MSQQTAHAPAPHACQPVDGTQCSTCTLAYNCRKTTGTSALSGPLVVMAALLIIGATLRLFGVV